MSESTWVDAENHLKTQLLSAMGAGGSYTSLIVKRVIVSPVRDTAHWETLAQAGVSPLLVIDGRSARFAMAAHPVALTNLEAEYSSFIIPFVLGNDEESVSRDVKILTERVMETMIDSWSAFTSTNGRRLEFQPIPNRVDIYPTPLTGCSSKWAGLAVLGFTFGKISSRGR